MKDIEDLRQELDRLDRRIIEHLHLRLKTVAEIAGIKRIRTPGDYRTLIAHVDR